jgi:hypothetical protein
MLISVTLNNFVSTNIINISDVAGCSSGKVKHVKRLLLSGQVIHTAKYADDFVLLAKEETVLVDRVIEIGRCFGMEINVEKTKAMRISRQPSPIQMMINQK